MTTVVDRRPVAFAVGTLGFIVALFVGTRLVLSAAVPSLTVDGISLVTNWLLVAVVVGLVAWLGWWGKIRLTAPVDRRALVYLVPLFGFVALPFAFGVAIPDVSLVEGVTLSGWVALLVIVVGSALGAGISEEILYRGVLLRALESKGRVFAALVTAALFALTHVSQVVFGASIGDWLVGVVLMIPMAIGLAAVAFRLGSLWPLIVWHVAADIALPLVPATIGAAATTRFVLAYLGLSLVVGLMGAWLLWQDRRVVDADEHADGSTDPLERTSG
ncbi:CPBP family intramembrane glutamic endopeptidase [Natronomonas marina]|jgi:membrane protease YdiL (CAAX protease family)|uniref:CPBP family intramembrane glutamic endopeptidase n=1 Tax=Natronomonas marina TaxID=2961939 RepID=UPI0020CA1526|nr:CPBP family intramembrane glutamic endopeptidase [Natronomonas marina]